MSGTASSIVEELDKSASSRRKRSATKTMMQMKSETPVVMPKRGTYWGVAIAEAEAEAVALLQSDREGVDVAHGVAEMEGDAVGDLVGVAETDTVGGGVLLLCVGTGEKEGEAEGDAEAEGEGEAEGDGEADGEATGDGVILMH